MTALFNFQFPESHKIIFAGMQTFARNPKSTQFQFSRILKIEGEREVQQACCCCVCEKICTTVAAAQFEIYAVYVCATQQ